ncbi:MAG: hypothetical protein WEG36_09685 [Gemmatimonadota bacterium]
MRVLLDTHIRIWSLLEPDRLSHRVRKLHADPADRFLCATASVYDLPLVTADARLLGYDGGFATIANE